MTSVQIEKLKELNRKNPTWYFTDIAKELGIKPQNIRWNARKLGLKTNTIRGSWNGKHKHLRKPVLEYFLNHSFKEVMEHFKLTKSELKSVFTAAYKNPEWAHIRKDTRRKDLWSLKEILFLLTYSGLQSRSWIAKKLKRGCSTNIKERLQKLGGSSKFRSGIPLTWAQVFWPNAILDPLCIQTKAGPNGINCRTNFKIIVWEDCLKLAKKYPTHSLMVDGIKAMIKYQKFIFQNDNMNEIKNKIEIMVKE